MSGPPSEPEKYSIDEMMDRLKAGPSENPEDGELVTRADGSQAIKVRRRKRRTTQPHKELSVRTRRLRIFQIIAIVFLIFLVLLALGGGLVYANSSPFRTGLLRLIGQATGAGADLYQFRVNPKTANANVLTLNWPAGNLLKSMSARGINAEISPTAFFGRSFTGEEITVRETSLTLQIPKSGEAVGESGPSDGKSPIRFNRYRTQSFNLSLGPEEKALARLYNSEASLAPETIAGLPQVRLYRGELYVTGGPNLRMDRALIEFRGNDIDLVSLRLQHPTDDRGSLELSGTISPYKPDKASNLTVNLESFQVDGITGPQLGRLLTGRIDSVSATKSNFLSFLPADGATAALDIAFGVTPTSNIQIQGFPFLIGISRLLDEDEWFERPLFETDATGVLHRENGIVSFRNLDLVSKGRIAIRGDLSMATDLSLSGSLQVGLAEAMIPKNSRLKSMAGPLKDGFRWIPLKISGSVVAPMDNFKDLYSEAAAAKEPATAPAEGTGSTFEELTKPR